MEDLYVSSDVRERLLLAGIAELEENGIKGFSLRKAALAAQVSCAAPYRHFKDKEEFIVEIIKYIASKWELMCEQIISVFSDDVRRLVIELAVANLRFWLSNPKFRSVLMLILESDNRENSHFDLFDKSLLSAIDDYSIKCGNTNSAAIKKYTVRALIYGSLMSKNDANVVLFFREKMEEEFPKI